jgi:hypothetical protein
MTLPNNLKDLVETIESLLEFRRVNTMLGHLPLDDLLEHIMGGHFEEALKGFECLVEPVREKSPEAAADLEKIISGELRLAKALPRLLECLSHVYPNTAKDMRVKITELKNGWSVSHEGKTDQ